MNNNDLFFVLFLILQCSADEALKQWMWAVWTGLQFRMSLVPTNHG